VALRHRETVIGAFNTPYSFIQRRKSDNAIQATLNTSGGQLSTKFIDDINTPGYNALVRCGKFLPQNPVVISDIVESRVAGGGGWTTATSYASGSVVSSVLTPSPAAILDGVLADVCTQAMSRANEADFDFLTFLAELKETNRLLASNLKQLGDHAIRTAKWARGRVSSARKRGGTRITPRGIYELFSHRWLETRYGWLPLIWSSADAINAYKNYEKEHVIQEGRASFVQSLVSSTTANISQANGYRTDQYIVTGTRTYRGFAATEFDLGILKSVGVNPALTAWELVPYSFVLDWVVDIGGWIQAYVPQPGIDVVGRCGSIKEDYTATTYWTSVWNAGGQAGTLSGGYNRKVVRTYQRVPGFSGVSPPRINVRLTLPRMIDLVPLSRNAKRSVVRILSGK